MLAIFIFMVPISLVCFWMIPRTKSRTLSPFSQRNGNFISAFSDRVNLNDIGSISQSKRHVLDLIPQNQAVVPSTYLVGRILDRYRSGVWTSTTKNHQRLRSPNNSGQIPLNTHMDRSQLDIFELSVRPIYGNPIFFFPEAFAIEIKDPINVEVGNKHLSHPSRFPVALHYRLICESAQTRSPLSMRAYEAYTKINEHQSYYRQKIQEIFGPEYETMSARQKLDALNNYYETYFLYTLDIDNYGAKEPLQYFLDTSQKGHCELFASSAVLILRAADVPARLVTGFMLPQMINDSFYHVTEASAHAWVEVYMDQQWVIFDPTSASSLATDGWLSENMAIMNRIWEEFIMMWDVFMQREVFAAVFQFFKKINIPPSLFFIPSLIFILAVLVLLLRAGWRNIKRKPVLFYFEKLVGQKPALTTWPVYLNSINVNEHLRDDLINWFNAYSECFFSNTTQTQRKKRVRDLMLQIKKLHSQFKRDKKMVRHEKKTDLL